MTPITKRLCKFINENNLDTISDIPDFILAEYLMACLKSFHSILKDIKKIEKKNIKEQS